MKLALAAVLVASTFHDAGAISACSGESGWASDGAEVAPHPRIVYWMSGRGRGSTPGDVIAKVDGKPVKTKVTSLESAPNTLAIIEIDSDAKGALTVEWKGAGLPAGHYMIKDLTYPKLAHATTSRYHSKLPHSTVREVFDGLAIKSTSPRCEPTSSCAATTKRAGPSSTSPSIKITSSASASSAAPRTTSPSCSRTASTSISRSCFPTERRFLSTS